MNSLSWMLYLADAANGVGVLFAFLGSVGLTATSFFGCGFYFGDGNHALAKTVLKWGYSISIPALFVYALIPSKTTIYAIAASEMGEEVIKSPTAGKAMKALDAWLDRQIEGEKKD